MHVQHSAKVHASTVRMKRLMNSDLKRNLTLWNYKVHGYVAPECEARTKWLKANGGLAVEISDMFSGQKHAVTRICSVEVFISNESKTGLRIRRSLGGLGHVINFEPSVSFWQRLWSPQIRSLCLIQAEILTINSWTSTKTNRKQTGSKDRKRIKNL